MNTPIKIILWIIAIILGIYLLLILFIIIYDAILVFG